jgi:L-methionine (R)-S-oxide reductase
MTAEHKELVQEFQEYAQTAGTATALMQHVAQRLHEKMARYNWVGFYLVDKADPNMLVMGPYVGSFAPNVCIPLHSGLCGAAATTRQTVVVDDVRKDPRYLQGSSMVISEIVVPIQLRGAIVGELDVESYFPSTFSEPEQEFLETCAKIVEKRLAKGV